MRSPSLTVAIALSSVLVACSGSVPEPPLGTIHDTEPPPSAPPADDPPAATSVIPNPCPAGVKLPALAGRALAPNGADPVSGALVYVPKGSVEPLPPGNQCDLCQLMTDGIWIQTHSAASGAFTLEAVPVGAIKVVIQLGRFRRVVSLETRCGETRELLAEETRLPRSSKEGDVPKVAVVTGAVDKMEHVLAKIGLEEVDLYSGKYTTPGKTPIFGELLDSPAKLMQYHILLVNCLTNYENRLDSSATVKVLQDFVAAGGRLFVDDLSYEFVEWPFPGAIDFEPDAAGAHHHSTVPQGPRDGAQLGDSVSSVEATILDPGLKKWLGQFPATLNANGTVPIEGFLSDWAVIHGAGPTAKVWVEGPVSFTGGKGTRPLSVSMDTVAADGRRCGRVAFNSYHTVPYESSPTAPFVPQERILQYLFFKVAACMEIE